MIVQEIITIGLGQPIHQMADLCKKDRFKTGSGCSQDNQQ